MITTIMEIIPRQIDEKLNTIDRIKMSTTSFFQVGLAHPIVQQTCLRIQVTMKIIQMSANQISNRH
jgi:hypothetical protein